jgi:hypothetical protein
MRAVEKPKAGSQRRPWVPPAVRATGTIGELLRGGGGKLSPSPKDPGEDRKVPAQE